MTEPTPFTADPLATPQSGYGAQPAYPPSAHPGGYGPQGQPGYPPQGQPGYPPQGQPGYPPQGQPGQSPYPAQPGPPGYATQPGPPGYPPQPSPPGYGPQPGYPSPGYGQRQAPSPYPAPPQGYPVPPAPGYPVQGYPAQGYPAQGYPAQGYPAQGYPAQGYPAGAAHQPVPPGLTCSNCGCGPATNATFRYHRGMIVLMHMGHLKGTFCRDCGTSAYRDMQARTLIQGWWGLWSFFIAPVTMLINIFAYQKIRALRPPQPSPKTLRPADPGRPVWQRPAILGLLVPIIVIVIFATA